MWDGAGADSPAYKKGTFLLCMSSVLSVQIFNKKSHREKSWGTFQTSRPSLDCVSPLRASLWFPHRVKREKRTDLLKREPLNSWIVKYLIWILSCKYYGFLVLLNHKSRSNLKWIWNCKTFQGLNNFYIVHETDQWVEFDWNCQVIYIVYVSM